MKVFMLAAMCFMLMTSVANAHTVFAPAGKNLKIHWAVLQSNPGMMPKIAEIGSRTVAKYTPNEPGTYSLYGRLDKSNPNIMRLLEIYEDEEAYKIHTSTEGFKAFVEERKPFLESVKFLPVDAVVLEQKSEGSRKDFENVPGKIRLSPKGLHISSDGQK